MTKSTVETSTEVSLDLTEAPIQVLHVDDETGFLKAAKQILEMQGAFEVETASSVEEALEKIEEKTYDVIISDYAMPEKGGLDFLKDLRQKGNTIPFIIFTGKGREEVAIEALNLGADHYINKIGAPETVYGQLANCTRKAVERKRAEMEIWQREEKLRAILASSPDAITASNLQGNIFDCNEAAWKMLGFSSKEELVGKSSFEFIAEKDRKRAWENLKKTLEEGTVRNVEYTLTKKDGEEYMGELSASILEDSSGNPMGFVGVVRDVTERKKNEESLRESDERFRTIFEGATDGILAADPRTQRFVFSNPRACEITGYSSEELLKLSINDIHPKEDLPYVIDQFTKQLEGNATLSTDIPVLKKDKQVVYCDVNSKMLKTGKQQYIVGFFKDVTERKKMEEERNKLLGDYVERVKELSCLYGIAKLVEKPKISLEEILRGTNDLLPAAWRYPDITCSRVVFGNREFKTKNFKETQWRQCSDIEVNGKKVGSVEIYYLEEKPTIAEGPFPKEERVLIDAVAERLGRIIERKKAENALKESEERYRSLFELAPDSIITANAKGVVTSINTTFTRLTGFSKDEIIGKHFTKVGTIRKRDLPMFLKMFTSLLRGKAPKPFEVTWKHKDGTTHPTEIHVTPVKSDGKTTGFQAITRDITERKKAREALRNANEKWVSLMENTDDVIMVLDGKGTIQDVNPNALVANPREVLGKSVYEYVPREQHDMMRKSLRKVFKTGKPDSYKVSPIIQGIGTIWFNTKVVPIKHDNKAVNVILISTNITERKKAEERVMESEERFRNLYESVPDALAVYVGRKGYIIEYNKAFNEWSGYSDEEMKDKTFLDFVHPDDRALVLEGYRTKYPEEEFPLIYEIKGLNKKGEVIPTEISVGTYKKKGRVIGINVMHRDITERKKAEEELKKTLENMQVLNEKLGVVGSLTRHDVRNKLSAARINIFLAEKKLAGNNEVLKHLWEIDVAIGLTEKIFDFARTYEKLGMEELAYMDVEKSLKKAVMLFSDLHGVKVVNDCHGLTVLADSLLRQLFYNLIHNSLKHGEKVGRIRVYYEEAAKDRLKLVYEDDGVGIPKAEKEKIFEKGFGKGTGYGLYLIRKMCNVYDWSIKETGKHGKGAQFTITMPRMHKEGRESYVFTDALQSIEKILRADLI